MKDEKKPIEIAPTGDAKTPELYPLDDAAISLLGDLKRNIDLLNAQWNGALVLFIRQHALVGNWAVAENGRELVRQPGPQ